MFSKKSTVRILGSNAFGDPLTLDQVKSAFGGHSDRVQALAIGQMALALREQCISDAFASTQSELTVQSASHQGAANIMAEMAQIISDLLAGRISDQVKAFFTDQ
jgi:hypothetical protein